VLRARVVRRQPGAVARARQAAHATALGLAQLARSHRAQFVGELARHGGEDDVLQLHAHLVEDGVDERAQAIERGGDEVALLFTGIARWHGDGWIAGEKRGPLTHLLLIQ
jgi:hypothetical protein